MEEAGHKDYRSLGEILRDARVAQGKSVEDVSELTKIAPKSIHALEADDLDRLAGPVYVRSFTKTMAEALSLDVEFLLTKLSHASSAMGPDPTAQVRPLESIPAATRVVPDPTTRPVEPVSDRDETTWHVEKVRVTRIESNEGSSPVLRWMLIGSAVVVVAAILIFFVQRRNANGSELGDLGVHQATLTQPESPVEQFEEALSPEVDATGDEAVVAATETPEREPEPVAVEDEGIQEEIVPPQDIRPVASNGAGAPGPQRREEPQQEPVAAEPEPVVAQQEAPAEVEAATAEIVEDEELAEDAVTDEEVAQPAAGNLGSILRPDDSEGARPMRSLHLSASEDVEVWIASDGDPPTRHLLRRGASIGVDGRDHFSLRLENPSSVVVVLDGVRHDPPAGLSGEWIIWADDSKQ